MMMMMMMMIITLEQAMRRSNRSTVSGYFLAGRFMTWLPVGASVFASNIGSEHFIGLAGSGAASGLSVAAFELNALLILQLCGWIFLPVFIASKVCTLPGYISKRFGGTRIQTYLAVLSMLLYVFTKISVNLFSGAIFIQLTIGWNIYTAQSLIMIIGSGTVAIKALIEIGGFGNLFEKYMAAIPNPIPANLTQCAMPKEDSFLMLRSLSDPDMPWLGFILGQTPASIWYWCADQMMVQRLLAAKSLSHAQGGALFAGYLKILPLFLIVIPGMISRILYVDQVACVDEVQCMNYCGNKYSCTNTAYPRLVLGLMPSPLKGLIMSVMLAALMSDLSSIFNSSSTLFTCDIWPRFRKNATVMELMIVGRAFVIVMIAVSIAWIPVIQEMQNGQLYLYIQDVGSNLAPPIAAVYILAVIFKRINEPGAFWSLMVGLLIGITRLVLNLIYLKPECVEGDTRPTFVKLHYMYFAIFLFWITVIICTVVSLFTEPPKDYLLIRTTYWTRHSVEERIDEKVDMIGIEAKTTVTNGSYIDTEMIDSKDESKQSIIHQFVTWFCGVTTNDQKGGGEVIQHQPPGETNIYTIEQNKKARLLNSYCDNINWIESTDSEILFQPISFNRMNEANLAKHKQVA
ncbi:Sodium/myo-inositol cotransporter [Blomia tropicalis]|nr:Sodium/myo-inositol cotransporter [Blomia tropicalis]